MSALRPTTANPAGTPGRGRAATGIRRHVQTQREGIGLLVGLVVVMWIVEIVNTIDSNRLDHDAIYGRSLSHLWGIFTAPFIHASFAHLIANTIPFVFLGLLVALGGAARLALVTLIVVVVGGIGTWLVAPSGVPTLGASGVVFGYAAYLLARGFFNHSIRELAIGLLVGVIWGGALLVSLVPHTGISWQGHLFGVVGGVVAALLLRRDRTRVGRAGRPSRLPAATAK